MALYMVFGLVFLAIFSVPEASGLSCLPCFLANCSEPMCDYSGYALNECGCCNVCAKAVGQECRGIWYTVGRCDKNLTCSSTKEAIDLDSYYPPGNCSDANCKAKVKVVFILDDAKDEQTFDEEKDWIYNNTKKIYERYGACAKVDVLHYGGNLINDSVVKVFGNASCINNENCYGRKLKELSRMGMTEANVYQALGNVDAESVAVLVTDGFATDEGSLTMWKQTRWIKQILTFVVPFDFISDDVYDIPTDGSMVIFPNATSGGSSGLTENIWFHTVNETESCPYPQDWTPCKSLSCEQTCADAFKICPEDCSTTGCICSEGYVRVSAVNRTCVKLADCPYIRPNTTTISPPTISAPPAANCTFPEMYRACSSLCPGTCSNQYPICPAVCGPPQCQCAPGYVRADGIGSKCILMSSCPDILHNTTTISTPTISAPPAVNCTLPEVYRACSSLCPGTCSNPYPICAAVCGPPQCQCAPGYVRSDGINSTCILMSSCPGNCSYPEVFHNCSSPCVATCDDPFPICQGCDRPKCECAVGYVRRSKNDTMCIPYFACPGNFTTVPPPTTPTPPAINCTYPEVSQDCSSLCEGSCNNPYPFCGWQCGPPKCQCAPGYVRSSGNYSKCIHMSQCPGNCTFPEVYNTCSSPCTATCDNPYPVCIERCDPPKCECADGYVRRSWNDSRCIPLGSCSANLTCDYPKIYNDCPSACPPTCDNPNPQACISVCGADKCICPPDHVLFSLTDRRCVHQYECPARQCMRACPPLNITSCAKDLAEAWLCHLSNWKCNVYDWKLQIEEWWYTSGCYSLGGDIEARWREVFQCPEYISLDCTTPAARRLDSDAFGCLLHQCADGMYKDRSQLLQLWKRHYMNYQEKLKIYEDATLRCKAYMGGGGGSC